MPYAGGQRVARRKSVSRVADEYSFPAPVRGWVTNENLATQQTGSARVLDNWFCTERGIRLRAGAPKAATIGSSTPTALFVYSGSSGTDKFFAADANNIYNISGLDPDTAPSADVSSLTGGIWSTVQQTTSGGEYLVACNGADSVRLYDGSSWSTASISGVTSSLLNRVWKFKSRVFFVEKDSTAAHALPVDSIGGTVDTVELGAIFQRGGYLLFGATWSLDAGDGVDDKCVFVSSRGEVAIYEGSDPSDATKWSLVGRYDISAPLGPEAYIQAGGDLIIATEEGLVPISQAIQRDVAALSLGAVSRPIEPEWRAQVKQSSLATPWRILKWSRENMGVVALPHADNEQYVVNLKTGAWSRYTGWDVQLVAEYGGYGYYADALGDIFRMELGGNDDGENILHKCQLAWDPMRSPTRHKMAQQIRATFRALSPFTPKISLATDYSEVFPSPPDAVLNATPVSALWGTGVWGQSKWGVSTGVTSAQRTVSTRWRSVAGNGFTMAPQIQVQSGGDREPDAELVQIDLTYEKGASVV